MGFFSDVFSGNIGGALGIGGTGGDILNIAGGAGLGAPLGLAGQAAGGAFGAGLFGSSPTPDQFANQRDPVTGEMPFGPSGLLSQSFIDSAGQGVNSPTGLQGIMESLYSGSLNLGRMQPQDRLGSAGFNNAILQQMLQQSRFGTAQGILSGQGTGPLAQMAAPGGQMFQNQLRQGVSQLRGEQAGRGIRPGASNPVAAFQEAELASRLRGQDEQRSFQNRMNLAQFALGPGVTNFSLGGGGPTPVQPPGSNIYDVLGSVAGPVAGASAAAMLSDERLKKDIKSLDGSLGLIESLEPKSYSWVMDETESEDLGLIAQDVKKVFPNAIIENPETGFLMIDYRRMIPPMIGAIKELSKQVKELS